METQSKAAVAVKTKVRAASYQTGGSGHGNPLRCLSKRRGNMRLHRKVTSGFTLIERRDI